LGEFLDSDSTELELPKCNAFVRRLIYQTTAQKYKNKIILQTKQMKNKDRILIATKFKSKEQHEEMEKERFDKEMTDLDDFIGFTKVLRIVVDSVNVSNQSEYLFSIQKFPGEVSDWP
jgi:poly(A)-specific ribonuclease